MKGESSKHSAALPPGLFAPPQFLGCSTMSDQLPAPCWWRRSSLEIHGESRPLQNQTGRRNRRLPNMPCIGRPLQYQSNSGANEEVKIAPTHVGHGLFRDMDSGGIHSE